MKVGDLVAGRSGSTIVGSLGIVTEVLSPTMIFPCELVTVTFFDGEVLEDIPSRLVEVQNEKDETPLT
jgi:hypothetical protein